MKSTDINFCHLLIYLFNTKKKKLRDKDMLIPVSHVYRSVKQHKLIVKLMKGDEAFRFASRSNIQFSNEVFIYTKVIPAYREFLAACKSTISVDKWIPRVYYGYYGKVPGKWMFHVFDVYYIILLDFWKYVHIYTYIPYIYIFRSKIVLTAVHRCWNNN